MNHLEKRFRLRKKETIVGYMRKFNEGSFFFSKDKFWWSGRKIDYQQVDEWTGFYDKNRNAIFELDLVKFKMDSSSKEVLEGAVLWNVKSEKFVICDLVSKNYFPFLLDENIELFSPDQLEVFSFLFINPDLMKVFGIEE